MAAADDWDAMVRSVPRVAEAFEALGTRGGERRSRARRRAAELDAADLPLTDIAWEVQIAAAEGETRERLAAAYARHRHAARTREAQVLRAAGAATSVDAGGAHGADGRPPRRGRGTTAVFVVGLIVALLAPALVMPAFRGGGFVYDVDQVALLSGVVSLAAAALALFARATRRAPFGPAVPVILGVWVAIGAVVAGVRLAADPLMASPGAIAGIVLMGVAVLVHVVSTVVGGRRARSAPSQRAEVSDDTAAALALALAGEDAEAAHLRLAAFADGLHTLVKRGELDRHDAEDLLRRYAS